MLSIGILDNIYIYTILAQTDKLSGITKATCNLCEMLMYYKYEIIFTSEDVKYLQIYKKHRERESNYEFIYSFKLE